jgi:hypothetical protein
VVQCTPASANAVARSGKSCSTRTRGSGPG